jgi:hypothetical protein
MLLDRGGDQRRLRLGVGHATRAQPALHAAAKLAAQGDEHHRREEEQAWAPCC